MDGDSTDNPVRVDINDLGIKTCQTSPDQKLAGHDDWNNLRFNFRQSPAFEDGIYPEVLEEELDFETAQQIKESVWRAQIVNKLYEYSAKLVCGVQMIRKI